MRFQIVGHACLEVAAQGKRLVVDPWLSGSLYWGSWWHCPEPKPGPETLKPDFVYITHWHFDHLHRESLVRFDRSCHVLLPKFPVSWLPEQLRSLGFSRVTEIEHGRPFEMAPGFTITSHQIQYQDDSLCVIEADGTVLVDLNDSKPLPRTWKKLRRRYPRVDFMLRSHSQAWSYPSAYTFEDPADAIPVDQQSYLKAFCSAAAVLKPRHAIPFASSVCHLHEEVLAENDHLATAWDLERYWFAHPVPGTELVRMPHGSSWSAEKGFEIAEDEVGRDVRAYVARLRVEKRSELEALYAREREGRVAFADFEAFFRRFLRRTFFLRPFLDVRWLVVVEQEGRIDRWLLDFRKGRIESLAAEPQRVTSRIRVHPAVLSEALREGVFTNIDHAKRWKVHVGRGGTIPHFLLWVLVAVFEAGCFEPRNVLRWRFVSGWARRRSEILDYLALTRVILREDKSAAAEAVTEPL
jgi:UDP-MurNAc hydroxylase